jgi:hypothetical protein
MRRIDAGEKSEIKSAMRRTRMGKGKKVNEEENGKRLKWGRDWERAERRCGEGEGAKGRH